MKNVLLPHRYKKVGWFLLIPGVIAGIILIIGDFDLEWLKMKTFVLFDHHLFNKTGPGITEVNVTNTLVGSVCLIGAMMVAFSKEIIEDEYINKLRLSSLLWAVWINYVVLLLCMILVYDMAFFSVMIYNMFTVLLLFILRFHYLLYTTQNDMSYEK